MNVLKRVSFTLLSLVVTLLLVSTAQASTNCSQQEWSSISSKYDLEGQFHKMQQVIETTPFNQTLYNVLNGQYNQSLTAADRECAAIGKDRADQIQIEQKMAQESNDRIRAEEERMRKEEDRIQKMIDDLDKKMEKACPSNSTLIGDRCWCDTGYVINAKQTACDKLESTPIPLPTTTPTSTPLPKPKATVAPSLPEEDNTSSPESEIKPEEKIDVAEIPVVEEEKPKKRLFSRVIDSVKGFFSGIFRNRNKQ